LTKAYENCVTEEGDRHHARFSYGVALSLFRIQVELARRGCARRISGVCLHFGQNGQKVSSQMTSLVDPEGVASRLPHVSSVDLWKIAQMAEGYVETVVANEALQ
jgi:hypothetical protein